VTPNSNGALTFSRDGRRLLSGGDDGSVGLWEVAGGTGIGQGGTFGAARGQLKHLRGGTLRWGIYAEAVAMVAFAQLTRLLLRAGGVNLGLGAMTGLTVASNAVALTLPGAPSPTRELSHSPS